MNSWNCCRTCLRVNALNKIFQIPQLKESYTEILFVATGLKVEMNDALPQLMCAPCIDIVNKIHTFRKECLNSSNILMEKLKKNDFVNFKHESHDLFKTENEKVVAYIDVSDYINNDEGDVDNNDVVFDSFNDSYSHETDLKIINSSETVVKIETIKDSAINKCDDKTVEFESTVEDVLKKHYDIAFENVKPVKRDVEKKLLVQKEENVKNKQSSDKFGKINGFFKDDRSNNKINRPNEVEVKSKEKVDSKPTSYECEFCQKVYKSKFSYVSHKRIHTGMKIVCEHCGKKFIDRRRLLMHCKAKHGYQKTDKCAYCDYMGISAESVKIHERLHTGEKPYVCVQCNASFHRKSSYLQHTPIHLPEKTVQCDMCPALFKSLTLMRIHKTRHKPREFKHKCRICGGKFGKRWHCLRHLHRIHGIVDNVDSHLERVRLNDNEK